MERIIKNRIVTILVCITLIVAMMPASVYAADEPFPGKPDGMDVSSDGPYNLDGDKEVWLVSSKQGGSIAVKENGSGYVTYEAIPSGGYAFSHWATYFVSTEIFDSFENDQPYDQNSEAYLFSDVSDKEKRYSKYDDTIRLNTSTDFEGRCYIYAVFVEGKSISVTVENGGALVYAKNLDKYNGSEDEYYVNGVEAAHFGVGKGSNLQVQVITDFYNLIEKVYINDVDVTNQYDVRKLNEKDYLVLTFEPVTESQNIKVVTKPKSCTITFDKNSETATGTMGSISYVNGTTINLPKNQFKDEGKVFVGWTRDPGNLYVDFADEGQVTQIGDTNEVLYAVWKLALDFTEPEAITGLVYRGTGQNLVTAGSCTNGKIKYKLDDGSWQDDIPQAEEVGDYKVYYYAEPLDSDYGKSEVFCIDVSIDKATADLGTVSAEPLLNTIDITKVVLKSTADNLDGNLKIDEGQSLNFGDNQIKYTYMPVDTKNYEIVTGTVNVLVKDTIAPTGEVSIGTNSWKEFLNNITFGMLFKETQRLEVEADDNLSGIDKIEYYESDKALTLVEVEGLASDKWTELRGKSLSFTAEDAKRFVYYIKITDKGGNETYLSTNGGEFDTAAPVISGVEDNAIYFETKEITVTDRNLDKVTVNGEEVVSKFSLAGNENATYNITAIDSVGNTKSVTIHIKNLPEDGVDTEEPSAKDQVKTGDKTHFDIMVGVLIVSGIAILIIALILIKKNRHKS